MHRLVLIVMLSMGLAACETTSSSEIAEPLAATPASTDAVARYAVEATPGSSAPVLSRTGANVTVEVGSYYTSALGKKCRRIVLSDGLGRSQVSAVCLVENSWTTVVEL